MSALMYFAAYAATAVFILAGAAPSEKGSRLPMHVRWELYPVAHEAKKAHYGGSYLEETDWWQKPRESSMIGELKVMIPEILFLVALKEHNPRLWIRSFPFHFGLYLTIASFGLMAGGGILGALTPGLMAGGLGALVKIAIMVCGYAGLSLAILGALGLLQRRLTDRSLRDFTSAADLFNLIFFVVAFGATLLTVLAVEGGFSKIYRIVGNIATFNFAAPLGAGAALPAVSIILMSLLMAYIPLTHMSHFIGKYFAYHAIRWNDQPNLKGGKEEAVIHANLSYPVSWAASHIKGDGKKTWVDVATEEIKK